MRLIIFLFLLCLSFLTFSQKEISNETHPFQVLFVDSANYIGKTESVKQFDFLEKYDLIRNSGGLVLLHYSGEILDTKEKIIDVREKSDKEVRRFTERPLISDPSKVIYNNKSIYRINSAGRYSYCTVDYWSILYPFNAWVYNDRKRSKNFYINWSYDEESVVDHQYIVKIKNIYDEILFEQKTNNNSINVDLTKFDFEEGLMIYSVTTKAKNEETGLYIKDFSGDIGVRFFDDIFDSGDYLLTNYHFIIDALIADQKEMFDLSNSLYSMAIEESNQDPRFIQLYEDFLARNPQFK